MFDNIEFKSSVSTQGKAGIGSDGLSFTLANKGGGVILTLGVNALKKLREINRDANGVELKITNDRVFAIKPVEKSKKRDKGDISNQQSVTAIKGLISDIPYRTPLGFVEYKGMLVCDLRENK